MKDATPFQLSIAQTYGIPKSLAHTINPKRVREYLNWRYSARQRLEAFLDNLEVTRAVGLRDGRI